jgi:hypothetical protein
VNNAPALKFCFKLGKTATEKYIQIKIMAMHEREEDESRKEEVTGSLQKEFMKGTHK